MANESFGKVLRAAPGWGEKAMWEAMRHPTLKNDGPEPAPLHKLTKEKIRRFREVNIIRK